MAEPLTMLRQHPAPWLMGLDTDKLTQLAQEQYARWCVTSSGQPPIVLLAEADPVRFLASFLAACSARCPVFLGNPYWAEAEWQQAIAMAQPDDIVGAPPDWLVFWQTQPSPRPAVAAQPGWILIPTGGSSGQIRFAIHTWSSLTASVVGFQQYFQVDRIHSCCVLPLYHVSGLMQFMRSLISGGTFAHLPWKTLDADGDVLPFDPSVFFLSLVPTQLQRLLQQPASTAWLAQFQAVLLGGAPAWADLLETARRQQIRLAPTYGMTETASQVVTLKPADFLQGQTSCGQVLPHAQLTICDEAKTPLPAGAIGTIAIQATSLMQGYYPTADLPDSSWLTDDLGFLDEQGYLHIVGRRSQKIISGGENVFPAEIEAAIRSTGLVQDVCVVGLPDPQWGERVVAVYVPDRSPVSVAQLKAPLDTRLAKFKHPKQWVAVDAIPRNLQGKVNYAQVKQMAMS